MPQLKLIVNEVTREVKDLISIVDYRDHTPNNLSQKERLALKNLSKRDDIILKPADKRGTVVIMDSQMYENEIYHQLNDQTVYKKIAADPTWGIRK